MAIIGLVYQKKGADTFGLAFIFFLTLLPIFLINPFAGVYIDRWDKRKIMFFSDFFRGVAMLAIGFICIHPGKQIPVYILLFLVFCAGRFFIPAKMSVIPLVASQKEIFMANSLISITATIAAMLGFGIGGLIVEWWGPQGGFFTDAISFFASSVCIGLIRIKNHSQFQPKDLLELGKNIVSLKTSFFKELKEGLRYIITDQKTFFSVKSLSILFACIGALYVVFITFVQQTLGTGTKDLGLLVVWAGIGLFIGSLLYGKTAHYWPISKAIHSMLLFSSIFLVFFVVILRKFPSGTIACLLSFGLGALISPIVVGANSLVHKDSDTALWGRIFSTQEVIMHFFFIVAMFVSSFFAKMHSPFSIIVFVGIIIVLFSSWRLISKEKSF